MALRPPDRDAPHAGAADDAGRSAIHVNRAALLLVLAACGDNLDASGSFEVVGHSDLGARGMNAALAISGTTAYVGSRIDQKPIEIVDIADPANPTVTGAIGEPYEALPGM